MVLRGQPGPRRQLCGSGEPVHVTDLGDEHRGQNRADPGDGLYGPVTGVGDQPAADQPGEQVDLDIEVVDQPAQRPQPGQVRRGCVEPFQQADPGGGEQVESEPLWVKSDLDKSRA